MPYSCTIQRHHALETRWPGLLFQVAFLGRCKTTRVYFLACVGINKTSWGAKLILTADLVHHLSCASLGHLLMAQHCHFCLNVCFSPPTTPNPLLPPTPLPFHPSTPYRPNLRCYRHQKNPPQKPGAFK